MSGNYFTSYAVPIAIGISEGEPICIATMKLPLRPKLRRHSSTFSTSSPLVELSLRLQDFLFTN